VNVSDEFVNLNSKIGSDVKILEKFSKNSDQNILKLHTQKEHLYKQLKTNREKINRALDAFEDETKRKLQSNFDRETGVIKKQQNELSRFLENFSRTFTSLPIFEFNLTNSSDTFTVLMTSSIFSTSGHSLC
jgi:predicted  nucleic acid-binding Zn-ribbon protein